ncbi:MAG: hypothetical protein ACSLE8_08020 [Rhodococcus sp. (in: high G+C Gram-positive bacteria)]
MTDSKALVDKLWNYCNVLRDELVSRGGTCLHKLYLPEAQRSSDRPDSVMRHLSSIPSQLEGKWWRRHLRSSNAWRVFSRQVRSPLMIVS